MFRATLLLFVLLFSACSVASKEDVLSAELENEQPQIPNAQAKPAIEIIEITAENFRIEENIVPDGNNIKRVKIIGAELRDVISLLTEATDENIIFQLESETSNKYSNNGQNQNQNQNINQNINEEGGYANSEISQELIRNSRVYVAATNIGFGKLLKKSVGNKISVGYSDGTYYLGDVKTLTLKIPPIKEFGAILQEALTTMGAYNVTHDAVTSSLSFSAREKEYVGIMQYLDILRKNLYVIEYEISIYNVELKDDFSLGINWNIIPSLTNELGLIATTAGSSGTVGALQSPLTFGAILNNGSYSGEALISALEHFGKVESIQRPKLLGLAGTNVKLTDGLEEPYIKEIITTSVANGVAQTSTVSGTALSGIEIILNSNILDETVITDIELKINDIVGYTNFEIDKTKYFQPKTVTKMIKNTMRVQAGVPIVISGLFRKKSDKGFKGIPGMGSSAAGIIGGTRYEGKTKSEMVIIVTPRVIQYIMK